MSMGYLNISSVDSWNILREVDGAQLVDVRTQPEWKFVGVPDLTSINKQVKKISIFEYPDMEINNNFLADLDEAELKRDAKLIFICRSGGRSAIAAELAVTNGFSDCYNVMDGFEGYINPESNHRNETSGWKYNQLPWEQS